MRGMGKENGDSLLGLLGLLSSDLWFLCLHVRYTHILLLAVHRATGRHTTRATWTSTCTGF